MAAPSVSALAAASAQIDMRAAMGASAGVKAAGAVLAVKPRPCNIGGRVGATVSPGDVVELLINAGGSDSSVEAAAVSAGVPAIASACGVSWRGHNPSMYKINQDRMGVAFDTATGMLLLTVFDGHGQNGHKVSEYMNSRMPQRLFAHPKLVSAPCDTLSEVLVMTEQSMLRGASVSLALRLSVFPSPCPPVSLCGRWVC